MTRAEKMRNARENPHVTFAEYLKIRTNSIPIFVFEGKDCPSYYLGHIKRLDHDVVFKQIIARGKKNVLALRGLIKRNASTLNDVVLYFVDHDFDLFPGRNEFSDVYVTRGYSIENEVFCWLAIEAFLRSCFDIADQDDENSINEVKNLFYKWAKDYYTVSTELHKGFYVCRRNSIQCNPGNDLKNYIYLDFCADNFTKKYDTIEQLFGCLGVGINDICQAVAALGSDEDFVELDSKTHWRGKFHFSFLKEFLNYIFLQRLNGNKPFLRAARPSVNPAHGSLLAILSAYVPAPDCLIVFLKNMLNNRAPYLPPS